MADKKQKKKEYELYKLWKSLPAIILGTTEQDLIKKFGMDDPLQIELIQIKTQKGFAEKYGLDKNTPSEWNERMEKEGNEHLDETRKWAKKLNKNVVFALYNKIMRKPDPVSIELWSKLVDGWNEKKELKIEGKMTLAELVQQDED